MYEDSQRDMARVTLIPELKGISGKIGNMVFKTYKNGQVRVYKATEKPVARSTKPSERELANRRRFAIVAHVTAKIQHSYEWADEAARDRHSIRKKVQYQYDKTLARLPNASDEDLTCLILHHFSSTLSKQSSGRKGVEKGKE